MISLSSSSGPDLTELMAVDAVAPGRFRTRCGEANNHGRIYGGQLIAQAMMAAARTVAGDRVPSMQQLLFLQGALPDQPIDIEVTTLQDGKRFASRHLRGAQGTRLVFDAQASFARTVAAPAHAQPPAFAADEDPAQLPTFDDLPRSWSDAVSAVLGYEFTSHRAIECRIAQVDDGLRLDPQHPRMRFWLRLREALPDDPALHGAAFGYLSDWWLNYPAAGAHLAEVEQRRGRMYVASLNHSIWLHRSLRADDWLHFDTRSPSAADGRGFTAAAVHDRQGRLVASVTQESLLVPRDG